MCIPLPALCRLNSLSQSLTALTAPSKREPLAYPQTLCPNRKLYRHAKGPILEGAGCDQREQTGGVFLHDSSRENEIAERPQTLRYLEIKNNFSADHAQSARGGHSKSSLLLRHGLQRRLLQVGDRDGAQRLQVGVRAVCGKLADLHRVFPLQVAAPACAVLVPLLA